MGRSSQPRKPYRPRSVGKPLPTRTQPWLLEPTFGPVAEILTHVLNNGELEEATRGKLIFYSRTNARHYEGFCRDKEVRSTERGREDCDYVARE